MYGFTTTLTGVSFDQAIASTMAAVRNPKQHLRGAQPDRRRAAGRRAYTGSARQAGT